MATWKWFIEYLSDCLLWVSGIRFKYMFWEYALYKDGIVVWLICDDTFFIKITPGTIKILWENYQKWIPYTKAKPQFQLDEWIIEDKDEIRNLIEACQKDLEK